MKNIFIFIFSLTVFTNVIAQRRLSGKIVDCESLPLIGASISFYAQKPLLDSLTLKNKKFPKPIVTVVSDFYGKFNLNLKKHDVKYLIADYNGYKPIVQEITSKKIIVKLKLDPTSQKDIIVIKKPVIYLYPKKETSINLKIDFNGVLTNTYPKYNNDFGWNIIAKQSGEIIDKLNNRKYSYLFWEGDFKSEINFKKLSLGSIVQKADLINFLETSLDRLGLNYKETNDFITYWLPHLNKYDVNQIYFMVNQECDSIASLETIPKPDQEIRVYMFFSKIDNKFVDFKRQEIPLIERNKNFTLVEWGGAEMNISDKITTANTM